MTYAGLAGAIGAAGTPDYVGRLVDAVAGLVPHDRITVTRYDAAGLPRFLAWRNFPAVLVERYLAHYHSVDPFNAYWRERRRPGVIPLRRLTAGGARSGPYVAEFLERSAIRDELGVLLEDGSGTSLGIFLERASGTYAAGEIGRLEQAFPALAALHDVHRRLSGAGPETEPLGSAIARRWPGLTQRESHIAALMLGGLAARDIARRLVLSPGTVRNHRVRIYGKLDITSERELHVLWRGAPKP